SPYAGWTRRQGLGRPEQGRVPLGRERLGRTRTGNLLELAQRLDRALNLVGNAGMLRLDRLSDGDQPAPVSFLCHRFTPRPRGAGRRRSMNQSTGTFAPRTFSLLSRAGRMPVARK